MGLKENFLLWVRSLWRVLLVFVVVGFLNRLVGESEVENRLVSFGFGRKGFCDSLDIGMGVSEEEVLY